MAEHELKKHMPKEKRKEYTYNKLKCLGQDIIDDVTKHLETNNYKIIIDRKEAILNTLKTLDNSCLLILGKGHEDYQIINNQKYHFSDKEIVLDYIKNN